MGRWVGVVAGALLVTALVGSGDRASAHPAVPTTRQEPHVWRGTAPLGSPRFLVGRVRPARPGPVPMRRLDPPDPGPVPMPHRLRPSDHLLRLVPVPPGR